MWRFEYILKNAEFPAWNNFATSPDIMANKTLFSLTFPLKAPTLDREEFFKRRSLRLHVSCQAEAVYTALSVQQQEYWASYRDGSNYNGLLSRQCHHVLHYAEDEDRPLCILSVGKRAG